MRFDIAARFVREWLEIPFGITLEERNAQIRPGDCTYRLGFTVEDKTVPLEFAFSLSPGGQYLAACKRIGHGPPNAPGNR
jgi:hypothetical protein